MTFILFLSIYFASLIIEVSFFPFIFGWIFPFSIWVLAVCLYFLEKDKVIIFGLLSVMISAIFFSNSVMYPVAVFGGSLISYLLKTVQGLHKKVSLMLHGLFIMALYLSLYYFIFFPGTPPRYFQKELLISGFLALLLTFFVSIKAARQSSGGEYRI